MEFLHLVKEGERWQQSYECECGSTHALPFTLCGIDELEPLLVSMLPKGMRILVVEPKTSLSSTYNSIERLNKLYRVSLVSLENKDKSALDNIKIDEDIRLVVTFDAPEGRYLAKKNNLTLVNIGSDASLTMPIKTHGLWSYQPSAPDYMVAINDGNSISELCQIASSTLALFDWDVSSLFYKKSFCPVLYTAAQAIVNDTLSLVSTLPKSSPKLKKTISSARLRLSLIGAYAGIPLLSFGGATQSECALSLLFSHENSFAENIASSVARDGFNNKLANESKNITREERQFLLSGIIARFYQEIFTSSYLSEGMQVCFAAKGAAKRLYAGIIPPPDNNKRAQALEEFLGVDRYVAHYVLPSVEPQKELDLQEHKILAYKKPLLAALSVLNRRLLRFNSEYIRLDSSAGLFLSSSLDRSDVALSLALGCDVLSCPSFLHFLRQKGTLDLLF